MITKPIPPYIIPPGRTIADEIQYRNWKQKDVAERLGITPKHLIDLIQ
jgi:plasmid maintenance system antidote protein VapI